MLRTLNPPPPTAMPRAHITIARIVLNRAPPPRTEAGTNVDGVRSLLARAFAHQRWRSRTAFAITPGGLALAPFPCDYRGKRGWATRPADFASLIPVAEDALRSILTEPILHIATRKTDFLTIGVDLNNDGWKGGSLRTRGPHAELVAVVETKTGNVSRWTGKSYPTNKQERMLVQQPDLETHLFRCSHGPILVLGCHDLNMFSARGRSKQYDGSPRRTRCDAMRHLINRFRPTTILHHPHSTDMPDVWRGGWAGAVKYLPPSPQPHVWASAIANVCWKGGPPRRPLAHTLDATACCDKVVDIILD